MEEKTNVSIAEAGKVLNISPRIIRYFCDLGFIPGVRRNHQGYRVLAPWQIDLLQTLIGLKQGGLSKKELRQYSRLFRQGDATLAERKAMLATRKRQLWQELEERQKAIDFIERQEEVIEQKLQLEENHAAE